LAEARASAGMIRPLQTLLAAMSVPHRRRFWLLTLLTLVNAAADLALVAASIAFLAALSGGNSVPAALAGWLPDGSAVGSAALLFAGSGLAANLLRLAHLRLSESLVAEVAHELTVEIQRRVFAQPYDYHVRHHSSDVLASLETGRLLASSIIHLWLQSVAALATGLALLLLLFRIDPMPAVAALALLALFYGAVATAAGKRLASNSALLGRAYGERIAKVQESLGAIRDLKIDHSEQAQLEDFRRADARFARASASTGFIGAAPRFVIEAGAVLLVALLAVWLTANGSGSALPLIGGMAVGGIRLLPLLQTAYRGWVTMAANRAIYGQVATMLSLPLPPARLPHVSPLRFDFAIRLEDVSFSYPERTEPVLRDVRMTIPKGARVALVGETGSGKSTLADIIIGLLRPQRGQVAIDGVPLDESNLPAWQRNIAHVSQSVFLADASIARNIAFSVADAPVDMERVRRVADAARLADFIDSLPDGFETEVGERGVRLSGGQRQRIAIARALYKAAPLLVLDEATNALDEGTEQQVLANIFADEARTVLIIGHRPSAVEGCDMRFRLAGGRLVAA
jgi:ATP-binding cassette, subfamily B, bacterial PglK